MILGEFPYTDLAMKNLNHFDFLCEVLGPTVGRATSLFPRPSAWINTVFSLLLKLYRRNVLSVSPYVCVLDGEARQMHLQKFHSL